MLTCPPTAGPPLPQTLLPLPRPRCQALSFTSFYRLPDTPILFRLPSKRKTSEELDGPNDAVSSSSKDFEAGRVTCEACGDSVSYQDERTGAFTTKHWDAHKLGWFAHIPPHMHMPRLPRFLPIYPALPLPPPLRPPSLLNHRHGPLVHRRSPKLTPTLTSPGHRPSADGLNVPRRSVFSTFVPTVT
jgi:hypothetical protein